MERIVSLLLLTYPAAFRRLYRDEMRSLAAHRWRECRSSLATRIGFWRWLLGDWLVTAPRVWALRFGLGTSQDAGSEDRPGAHHRRRSGGLEMDSIVHDVRSALRGFRKSPGVVALVVVSLALGVGANTTIFSLINALFWRPLPAADPHRLVRLGMVQPEGTTTSWSYARLLDLQRQTDVFSGVLAHSLEALAFRRGERGELVFGEVVSSNYFDVLGVPALYGRTFRAAEDGTLGGPPTAVLSHALWQRSLGGDPAVIGETVEINGHAVTVLGIAPPRFTGTKFGVAMDAWLPVETFAPHHLGPGWQQVRSRFLQVVARLAPGIGHDQAQEAVSTLARQLAVSGSDIDTETSFLVLPERAGEISPSAPRLLAQIQIAALAASGLVLLIAIANVANLLLGRAVVRRRELGLRLALGAGRARLARQLLTENLMLALAGGALALGLTAWTGSVLQSFVPPLPYRLALDATPDLRVLGYALLLCFMVAVLLSVAPALGTAGAGHLDAMLQSRTRGGRERGRLGLLVVAQVAFSMISLVLAGLFVGSLRHARQMDPGFGARNGLLASFDLGLSGYDAQRGRAFYERLLAAAADLPGARSAALVQFVPLGDRSGSSWLYAADRAYGPNDRGVPALRNVIGREYPTSFGLPILQGRGFGSADDTQAPPRVLLNQALAERLWPGESPVGRNVRFSPGAEQTFEVVGMVRDGKYQFIAERPQPAFFFSFDQIYRPDMTLFVRSEGDSETLIAALRERVRELDPTVPIFSIKSLEAHLFGARWAYRLAARLALALGLLSLILATVGLYGVLAFVVAQRQRELAIRIAVGARRGAILELVLRRAATLIAGGVLLGAVAAFGLAGLLSGLLLGVEPRDPATFALVAAGLAAVALAASLHPARRATRVDPVEVLRSQ